MIHTILILIMRKLFQLLHLARPTVSLGMNAMKLSATALVLTLATLTGCALEMAQPSDSALEAPISAQEVVVQVPVITITSENFGLDEAHAITFLFALDPEFTSDERLTIEAALSAWNPHMPHVTFGVVTDDSPSIHTIAKGYTPYAGASGGNIGGRIETGDHHRIGRESHTSREPIHGCHPRGRASGRLPGRPLARGHGGHHDAHHLALRNHPSGPRILRPPV